jgi:chromate transporter
MVAEARRASIAFSAAIVSILLPSSVTQICLIVAGALAGLALLQSTREGQNAAQADFTGISRSTAIACLAAFGLLLLGLPVLRAVFPSQWIAVVDTFYRSGSLVFGGGHVVLPLLQREVVPPGWVSNASFLAGYGAAQAVPGPLFTFAAYLGAVLGPDPNGIPGAAIALSAIYLPSFLLVIGLLPFYSALRSTPLVRVALSGVNAAVVGILLAALYSPVWTSAIVNPADFALGLAAFLLLAVWKMRPWIIVLAGAIAGEVLSLLFR